MEAFCYSDDALVDVVDDAPLLIECPLQVGCEGLGILKSIAKIGIGLLEAFPAPGALEVRGITRGWERCK